MKRLLKRAVQEVVAVAAPLLWRFREPSLLVLMYHRVLPGGHPAIATEQPGMFVSPGTLRMHIEVLRRHFQIMHLDDWLTAVQAGKPVPRMACALTFDDGWRDNYEFAFPVLRETSAPATIYLVSDLVGSQYEFWPNRLVRMLRNPAAASWRSDGASKLVEALRPVLGDDFCSADSLPPGVADEAIAHCKVTFTDAELDQMLRAVHARDEGAGVTSRGLMSWEEIREMQASGLVRFGSHSRRHTRLLSSLSPAVLDDEILRSAEVISAALGSRPATFCYPNGDHSPQAVAAVRGVYLGATTTARGWNGPRQDFHLLNRVGVHEDVASHRSAFLARLAGVG